MTSLSELIFSLARLDDLREAGFKSCHAGCKDNFRSVDLCIATNHETYPDQPFLWLYAKLEEGEHVRSRK